MIVPDKQALKPVVAARGMSRLTVGRVHGATGAGIVAKTTVTVSTLTQVILLSQRAVALGMDPVVEVTTGATSASLVAKARATDRTSKGS